ncbi:MAG: hypothetical protein QOD01_881, partial [Actinomycetota bacterium]|nr:hypothetical protein [Actinomycetota bacterium]
MDTIPQSLATPQDGYGAGAPDAGRLGEARNKLAAALWAFSLAQAAVPGLEAALAAGAPLPRDDLFELDRVRSALAEGAQALDLDPDRATLADLEARLASWERAVALRHRLERMAQATGPAGGGALAVVAADAARLAGTASWSPDDEVHAMALGRLVELVDVVAGGGEDEHVLALDAELRSNLGPAAAPVVLAAVRGRLVLPDHPVVPFEANGHPPPGSGPPPTGPPPVQAHGRENGSLSSGRPTSAAASPRANPGRRWWVLGV